MTTLTLDELATIADEYAAMIDAGHANSADSLRIHTTVQIAATRRVSIADAELLFDELVEASDTVSTTAA